MTSRGRISFCEVSTGVTIFFVYNFIGPSSMNKVLLREAPILAGAYIVIFVGDVGRQPGRELFCFSMEGSCIVMSSSM